MAHSLILGMTESGKTTLAKRIAKALKRQSMGVIVLDPILDPEWSCDFITDDFEIFLDVVRRSRSCFLFVDEAAVNCGNWDKESHWLATQARHWGHSTFFACQRCKQIAVNIRDNCSFLYLFKCGSTEAKELSQEWCNDDLLAASHKSFKLGQYFYASRSGEINLLRVF